MELNTGHRLKIAFYGDDFTGSTDALESLTNYGLKTMLFIDVPVAEKLKKYKDLDAIGIAGMSRTFSPAEMEDHLRPAFVALAKLHPKHVHYKICSTFDSSPSIGSIGKAIDIGTEVFKTPVVPLLVAVPPLGRYCLFGNLFARMGIGSEGTIFRLDRHPSMSRHPVTPADESDLRLHLGKQTKKKIGLVDLLSIRENQPKLDPNDEILLFDALENEDLNTIGEIIDSMAEDASQFIVGSSGVGMALGSYWAKKKPTAAVNWKAAIVGGAILVVSGSCSLTTANQIKTAIDNGFVSLAIDTIALAENLTGEHRKDSDAINRTAFQYAEQVMPLIKQGKQVIVHTSISADDPRVTATDRIFKEKGLSSTDTAKFYGTLLGQIAKLVAAGTSLSRIVVAGGDTSSYAARAMGIEAVEMLAPLSPGAPICLAIAPHSPVDRLQVVFKGGQVGKPDFFITAAKDIIIDN
ncbi:MAG: four-carbon acid sugar kinase family protein [Pedobacter sp.]|nr:four-carbon acid sugar kinase family protein [Pedobacter sp.]MDQ8051766.1 four-carbon acid sugar kinase family protein [Pedobacter sp.]